jgi:hypothetical protein
MRSATRRSMPRGLPGIQVRCSKSRAGYDLINRPSHLLTMTQNIRLQRPARRPVGVCIFCGNAGVTKEHLLSDWLREEFPRRAEDTHTLATVVSWTPKPTLREERKQGHSGSRKIRKVCRTCNSGWISRLDDAAKRIATPLIRGAQVDLSTQDQQWLAAWLSKIAMVADSAQAQSGTVEQIDRDWLRHRGLPPLLWEVWIGFYGGIAWRELGVFQHGGHLDLTRVLPGPYKFSGYATSTAMGLGSLFALVIGNGSTMYDINIGKAADILTRILPGGKTVKWPLTYTLSDEDASAMAYILRHAVANPHVV